MTQFRHSRVPFHFDVVRAARPRADHSVKTKPTKCQQPIPSTPAQQETARPDGTAASLFPVDARAPCAPSWLAGVPFRDADGVVPCNPFILQKQLRIDV